MGGPPPNRDNFYPPTLVGSALATYVLARHEVRTLATVAILGPFTLVRPVVIVGAALVGLALAAPLG